MVDYYKKYIKYKYKYLHLQSELIGGSHQQKILIIHISGPSGSGKTTLGNKLSKTFGKKIIVKDLDDLRLEFINHEYGGYAKMRTKIDKDKYQKWIDDFINEQTKPIIFVGLNHMPWWHHNHYYDLHSQYNFYIKLDTDTIFKQKCGRFITDVNNRQNEIINNIILDEKSTIKNMQNQIQHECGYDEIKKMNNIWNYDYKNQNYKILSRQKIFDAVSKLINKEI